MKKMTNKETKKDNDKHKTKHRQTEQSEWRKQTWGVFPFYLKSTMAADKAHNSWLVYGVLGKHSFVVIKFSKP